ncbi:MAG: hypothetical protein M0C28_05815 [Candidatus Moduliflexus flocculans]|nr:hypothetical protein [Candidatus Moduliflexus flocculans]
MGEAESVYRKEFPVKGGDFAKAGDRRLPRSRRCRKDPGLDAGSVRRAAIAAYESEMNVIMYAWEGRAWT